MKLTTPKKVSVALSLASLTLLAACGGGGSGDSAAGQTNTSVITSSNAQAVSAQALNANTAVNGGATTASGFATGVSISGNTTAQSGLVRTVLEQLYKGLNLTPSSNLVTGVTTTESGACSGGGTISATVTYSSEGRVSNGDSVTITSTNCVEAGKKMNGKLTMTFSNLSGTIGSAYNWGATLALAFTNFSVEENGEVSGVNGDMTLAYSQTNSQNSSASITGSSMRATLARNGATVLDETLASYNVSDTIVSTLETQSSNFTFTDNLAAKLTSYVVKTITPFKQTSGSSYPYQGALTITAGNGSKATVTALDSTNVRIDVDSNGDGTVDQTINTTWVALDGLI